MIAKTLTNNEAHTLACELETQILKLLHGNRDYVVMTAMTYAMATLIVQLPTKGATVQETLDTCDFQLRSAVAILQKHKRYLDKPRSSLN